MEGCPAYAAAAPICIDIDRRLLKGSTAGLKLWAAAGRGPGWGPSGERAG